MSVAARTAERVEARRASFSHVRLGTLRLLALLIGGSFVLRTAVGWLRQTPIFLPDEYIYAELGRSIAETGRPLVRGVSASFPSLLQPILTAPAWLFEDVATSYRVVQAIGALAMSLAAVPVFLLARRLGLGAGIALALAALALAVPDVVYASFVVAEPFAYPLALGAVAAGTAALARPGPRAQVAFLALAGLASFARIQFVVLPLCYLAAVALMGLVERRFRGVVREQRLTLALLALPVLAVVALGPGRVLGFYDLVLEIDLASTALVRWFGTDAMMLVYASGVVLVPGAIVGIWLALRRPRSRDELAFAALALPFTGALLLEAAAYGVDGSRTQERYFFYAVPLVAVAFALYASRGWPHRLAHVGLAAALAALVSRIPLGGFSAASGKTSAPLLFAHARLEKFLGDIGLASLLVAAVVTVLLAAVVLAGRSRRGTAVAMVIALAVSLTAYAGAAAYSVGNSASTKLGVLGPGDPSFIDRLGRDGVVMLQSRRSERALGSVHLFWNRSVDSIYLLPGAPPPDAFDVTELTIAPDGTLLAGGEPVRGPLAVDAYSDTVVFRDSAEIATGQSYRVVDSARPHRLALYAPGRYADGWLGLFGHVELWPETDEGLAGTLAFRLTSPDEAPALALTFEPDGTAPREVLLAPGESREVSFSVCGPGPWKVDFAAPFTGNVNSRYVSVQSSEPVFRPDPAACP